MERMVPLCLGRRPGASCALLFIESSSHAVELALGTSLKFESCAHTFDLPCLRPPRSLPLPRTKARCSSMYAAKLADRRCRHSVGIWAAVCARTSAAAGVSSKIAWRGALSCLIDDDADGCAGDAAGALESAGRGRSAPTRRDWRRRGGESCPCDEPKRHRGRSGRRHTHERGAVHGHRGGAQRRVRG